MNHVSAQGVDERMIKDKMYIIIIVIDLYKFTNSIYFNYLILFIYMVILLETGPKRVPFPNEIKIKLKHETF